MSWVGLDDVVGAFHHALFDDSLHGPVNVTAPGVGLERARSPTRWAAPCTGRR